MDCRRIPAISREDLPLRDEMVTDRKRLLVVDDDRPTLCLIAGILKADYEVLTAHDGRAAWELIDQWRPDMVITDWNMPGLDGVQLCRKIREMKSSRYTYVILVTAKSRSEDMVYAMEAGADDFMSKSVTQTMLLARVRAGIRILDMERQLRHCSERDPLTDTLNRRAFFSRFDDQWERSIRERSPLSCVLVDIDFFKGFNDTYGHAAGDRALRTLADLLARHCRSGDVVCRYGGEEFCVLLPEMDEADAVLWAERVGRSLANLDISVAKEVIVRATASFGVAARRDSTQTPEELTMLADRALAVAKVSGRNCVATHDAISRRGGASAEGADRLPLEGVLAHHVMTPSVFCLDLDDPVSFVAETLLQVRLDSTPVVDSERRLTGVVSTRDLLATLTDARGWEKTVRDIMRTDVVSYHESSPVHEIAEFLFRSATGTVVVVRDGRPVGTISVRTLLRWCHNWLAGRAPGSRSTIGTDLHQSGVENDDAIRLVETAVRQLCQFRRELAEGSPTSLPRVVGEATNLQELASDLLGQQQGPDAGLVL